MNPLQEQPHLFANGNFSFKAYNYISKGKDIEYWKFIEPMQFQHADEGVVFLKDATLIARPIADMTDEELNIAFHVSDKYGDVNEYEKEEWQNILIRWANLDDLGFALARYLKSIGVYPFNQKHFDGGTVIDSRTL